MGLRYVHCAICRCVWFIVSLQRGSMLYNHTYTAIPSVVQSICHAVVYCFLSVFARELFFVLSRHCSFLCMTWVFVDNWLHCTCPSLSRKYKTKWINIPLSEVPSREEQGDHQGQQWCSLSGHAGEGGGLGAALEVTSVASDASTPPALTQRDYD